MKRVTLCGRALHEAVRPSSVRQIRFSHEMAESISIHVLRKNHFTAYPAAPFAMSIRQIRFQCAKQGVVAISIHAPRAVSITYSFYRFARRIFPSATSTAAANA